MQTDRWVPMMKRFENIKVMLVDEDESIRRAMAYLLETKTAAFKAVETAEEAITCLNKESWGVVICDCRLPGMNGIEFFEMVQKTWPHIRTTLMVTYGCDTVLNEASSIGVHDFLQKPFNKNEIERVLTKVVRN